MKKELEVCVYSVESIYNAQKAGATRIELCAGYTEGGITPSAALIRKAVACSKMEVAVMIRPRGGDFLYTESEYELMKGDIAYCKSVGADCVVLGVLNADGDVDTVRLKELVELAAPMEVAFHRAFDMSRDSVKSLEDLIACRVTRLLTSGMSQKAIQGETLIAGLVDQAAGRIEIMAGSGVNSGNAAALLATGVDALHMSGNVLRESEMVFRNPNVSMCSAPLTSEYVIPESSEQAIREVVELM